MYSAIAIISDIIPIADGGGLYLLGDTHERAGETGSLRAPQGRNALGSSLYQRKITAQRV